MDLLKLPQRTVKSRNYGLTNVHEVGCPVNELRAILTDYHALVDVVKLGMGTAYVTPNLEEKIELYQEFGITVYLGGTLFERFYHYATLTDYKNYLKSLGITWVEVSNGTIDISLEERIAIVQELSQDFVVLAEVGTKNAQKIMPASQWVREIKALLEAGCRYVITEGRSSGTAGIYRPNHEIRAGLISEILSAINAEKIIFEAPLAYMQTFFINTVGANVNLGNISPRDLLLVETQRRGLSSETFFTQNG